MDPYTFSLTLGGVGLGVMALSGFAQAAHVGHEPRARTGTAPPTTAMPVTGTRLTCRPAERVTPVCVARRVPRACLHSCSPRVAFSVLVGIGAAGLLLRPLIPEPGLLIASLGAGLLFEWGLVGPLWRFLFRFASAPAQTLESVVSDEARAVTSFDANGNGLVAVELDGQVVQLLATLNTTERAAARKVRAGDRLRIEAVDDTRNRCTVTYLGA